MSLPPEDVDPVDLFQQLAGRNPPTEVVPYPSDDTDQKIRIMGLDTEDLEPLVIAARKKLKDEQKLSEADLETKYWDIRLQDRTAREILSRAIRYVEPIKGSEKTEGGVEYPYLFKAKAENVSKLPPREIGILWALWNLVQNRINPTESSMHSPDEVRAWVQVLSEGARPFAFFQLDLPQQEVLLSSLLRWAKLLLVLLESLPEQLPKSWDSALASCDIDTGWCSSLAASSTPSTSETSEEPEEVEAISAEEAEEHARSMLKMARKMSDDERE